MNFRGAASSHRRKITCLIFVSFLHALAYIRACMDEKEDTPTHQKPQAKERGACEETIAKAICFDESKESL